MISVPSVQLGTIIFYYIPFFLYTYKQVCAYMEYSFAINYLVKNPKHSGWFESSLKLFLRKKNWDLITIFDVLFKKPFRKKILKVFPCAIIFCLIASSFHSGLKSLQFESKVFLAFRYSLDIVFLLCFLSDISVSWKIYRINPFSITEVLIRVILYDEESN